MRQRSCGEALKGLDLAECEARRGTARQRALALAQVAIDAAKIGDTARMARCLDAAQRDRRTLNLSDQVAVLDRLVCAALAADAPAFARLLHSIAMDCARRIRRIKNRTGAMERCAVLAAKLGEDGGPHLRLVSETARPRMQPHVPNGKLRGLMLSCA